MRSRLVRVLKKVVSAGCPRSSEAVSDKVRRIAGSPLAMTAMAAVILGGQAAHAEPVTCLLYRGTPTKEYLTFAEGIEKVGFPSGTKADCLRVPVEFSTIRDFPEGVYAVSHRCGEVDVYLPAEGNNAVFYAAYEDRLYRCAP